MNARSYIFSSLLAVLILFQNCTTKKNTFIHRGYHNLTARFNGYYWSNEAIKDGIYKIEKNNKENYDKILPVYVTTTNENAKTTFPEFDKAIKKASLVIQRHTIRDKKDNEIPSAGKWIDNNWINIGISHFYKREFFSGIEAFEYVSRTYVKSKDKYDALLWQARSYNEIGAVSQSDPIIGLLANDKKIPKKIKSQLYAVKADYFIKRGLYKEAIPVLMEAVAQKNLFTGIKKKQRARFAFIVAQLFEEEKNNKRARQFYEKVIDLKPTYDMIFYANIKLSRLVDLKSGNNVVKVKNKLLKMTKDYKNIDYLDVIYYTLGEIEEKEKNVDQAVTYYKKSARSSVSNPNQKALSYLKLGEIHFERGDYPASGSYYDSTVAVLPKDHPEYNSISTRKKTLEVLVGYINIIHNEDSLQRLARMSESERNRVIDKIITKIEDDEQKRKDELENALAQNLNPANTNTATANNNLGGNGSGAWYFYNQTTISFGISDFAKKWGNRKLEDNWRRSQKNIVIEGPDNTTDNTNPKDPKNTGPKNKDPKKTRIYYTRQLPLNDSLMTVSNNKIIEAEYLLGATYKEDLNNNKRSIATFEDLNKRYAEHKYRLQCYYQLFRIYLADKNQPQSDFYKNKLLTEYPNSEYSKLIRNPKYAEERNTQRSEVERSYIATFDLYNAGDYATVLQQCDTANARFGRTEFTPKYEFMRAMCLGKLKGIDTLESAMKQFTILYPKSDITPRANEILLAIKRQRDPSMFSGGTGNNPNKIIADTFKINFDVEHMALIVAPDDPKMVNPFKLAIDEFNQEYYSNKQFSITSNLFASAQQMIMVKSFPNAREAQSYLDNLKNDTKIYTGSIKKEAFTFLILSNENLPFFFKKANSNSYRVFYEENYKTIFNSPNK